MIPYGTDGPTHGQAKRVMRPIRERPFNNYSTDFSAIHIGTKTFL